MDCQMDIQYLLESEVAMAEYIDVKDVEKLIEYAIEDSWELDYTLEKLKEINKADVIERSEYEKLRLVNLDLAETNKGLLAEHEQLLKLRSEIDKAIEEMERYGDGFDDIGKHNLGSAVENCIEILKRNIGE